jgi:hypothetical protein
MFHSIAYIYIYIYISVCVCVCVVCVCVCVINTAAGRTRPAERMFCTYLN